jgi:hypothetical protein
VKTYCDYASGAGIVLSVNPVERRIWELASFQLGRKKKFIRALCRKAVVPNRRYSWMMFEHQADTDPVEVVVLDMDLAQAVHLDLGLAETFKGTLLLAVADEFVPAA